LAKKKKECFQPPKITGLSCPTKTAKLQEVCFQRAKRTENETWDKKPAPKMGQQFFFGGFIHKKNCGFHLTHPVFNHHKTLS